MKDLEKEAGTLLPSLLPTTTERINCPFKRQMQHYAFCRRKGVKIYSKQPAEEMHPCLSRKKNILLFVFISNIST